MTYRQHGHVPSDVEIEKLGPKAFPPKRPAHVPTAEEFQRAAQDLAPGDDGEEYAAVADGLDISHQGDDLDAPFWISAADPPGWVMRPVEPWYSPGRLATLTAAWDRMMALMVEESWPLPDDMMPWPI